MSEMDEEYEAQLKALLQRPLSETIREAILSELSLLRNKDVAHQLGNSESAENYFSGLSLASGF